MFDHENHFLDEKGFARHKETGHLIGIEGAPAEKHPDVGGGFPRWVVPHADHVVREQRGDIEHISTPHFTQHHVRRHDGEVTVLAHTPEEAEFALAAPAAAPLIGM
jgi:hypothetical protein